MRSVSAGSHVCIACAIAAELQPKAAVLTASRAQAPEESLWHKAQQRGKLQDAPLPTRAEEVAMGIASLYDSQGECFLAHGSQPTAFPGMLAAAAAAAVPASLMMIPHRRPCCRSMH